MRLMVAFRIRSSQLAFCFSAIAWQSASLLGSSSVPRKKLGEKSQQKDAYQDGHVSHQHGRVARHCISGPFNRVPAASSMGDYRPQLPLGRLGKFQVSSRQT
jgi:hypothetical protein